MNTKKDIVQDPLFTIIGECSTNYNLNICYWWMGKRFYFKKKKLN